VWSPILSADTRAELWIELHATPGAPEHDAMLRRNLARTSAWHRRQLHRALADAGDLNRFERRIHSQGGEDGIIAEIMRRAGETNRRFVEIGSGDGSENCTRALLERGWRGCWIDAEPEYARAAAAVAGDRAVVLEAMVGIENVRSLLDGAAVGDEPDVVSIDIDGNDYWIWNELARSRRPRLVVIEYNAKFPPPTSWVLPYSAERAWDGSCWQGATLSALNGLGARLGYRLVCCNSFGTNSFFVREDVARASADLPALTPEEAYWPAGWNPGHFGHPAVVDCRAGRMTAPEFDQVLVADAALHADLPLRQGQPVPFSMTVHNWGRASIGSCSDSQYAGTFVVCEWLPAGGSACGEWFRWGGQIQGVIDGRCRRLLIGGGRAPDRPGEYIARVALAQEASGPAPGGAACCEIPVTVEPWPAEARMAYSREPDLEVRG
jgi:hypothetical protein